MMRQEKFVPLEKQSKQARRTHYAKQRGSWEGVVPVTRQIPDRKRERRQRDVIRSRMED